MMRTFWVLSLALGLCLLCSGPAHGVGTVVGTSIEATTIEAYHDGGVDYSNSLSFVLVDQDHGLDLNPVGATGNLLPGESYYFPHTVTNIGNGSDLFTFALSGTTDNWTSTLIRDENMNGFHEPVETTPVPNNVVLAEDASYYFFAVLTAPADLNQLVTGATTLSVSCTGTDGDTYIGANGLFYGGPDLMASALFGQITAVDNIPPTITDLRLNGRRRFDDDIISARLRVEATILDDQPGNVARIEIWLNDEMVYQGTSSDWLNAFYDPDTGAFDVDLPELEPGEYRLRIIAWDGSGNQAEESLERLQVNAPSDIRIIGPPVNYPNPFAPLKGEQTAISYTLSTDMEITLYIYNIVGTPVWRRTFQPRTEGGNAGYNEIIWNGYSDFGEVCGNALYIYKIVNNNKVIGKGKVTLLDRR